jgi:hypothetical protein
MSDKCIDLELNSNITLDKPKFQKMIFIMNALEKGWSIKKNGDSYIFTKKHENRREIFMESYLEKFMISNMNLEEWI